MSIHSGSRQILIHGMALVPAGLVWGLVIPGTPFPRLALGAHIQFVTNGLLLMVLATAMLTLPHRIGTQSIWLGHGCRCLADVGDGPFRGGEFMVGNNTDVADFGKPGWRFGRRFLAGDDRWLGPYQRWAWADCGLGASARRFSALFPGR